MTQPQADRVTFRGREVTNPWVRLAWAAAVPFVYLWVVALNIGMQFVAILILMGVLGGFFCLFFGAIIFGAAAIPLAMLIMADLFPWFLLAMLALVAGHFVLRRCGRNGFFSGYARTDGNGAFTWGGSFDFSRNSFRQRVMPN